MPFASQQLFQEEEFGRCRPSHRQAHSDLKSYWRHGPSHIIQDSSTQKKMEIRKKVPTCANASNLLMRLLSEVIPSNTDSLPKRCSIMSLETWVPDRISMDMQKYMKKQDEARIHGIPEVRHVLQLFPELAVSSGCVLVPGHAAYHATP